MQIYRKRDHWEDREDSEWRIEPDALIYRNARNEEYRYPWKDIAGVRARWSKKGSQPSHVCSVWLTGSERSRCEFDDLHVVTVGEYKFQEDYPGFLRAVLVKIIEKSPTAKAWKGLHRGLYLWLLLVSAPLFLGAGFVAFNPNGLGDNIFSLFMIAAGAILVFLDRPQSMPVSKLLEAMSR
jgi:hypothetical protein